MKYCKYCKYDSGRENICYRPQFSYTASKKSFTTKEANKEGKCPYYVRKWQYFWLNDDYDWLKEKK